MYISGRVPRGGFILGFEHVKYTKEEDVVIASHLFYLDLYVHIFDGIGKSILHMEEILDFRFKNS